MGCATRSGVLRISNEDIDQANGILREFAPALVDTERSGRCFCDAYGPARSAVVASVSQTGRVVFAGAGSGSGFRIAPGISQRIAEQFGVLSGEHSEHAPAMMRVQDV